MTFIPELLVADTTETSDQFVIEQAAGTFRISLQDLAAAVYDIVGPYVRKSGDTMTGPLAIDAGANGVHALELAAVADSGDLMKMVNHLGTTIFEANTVGGGSPRFYYFKPDDPTYRYLSISPDLIDVKTDIRTNFDIRIDAGVLTDYDALVFNSLAGGTQGMQFEEDGTPKQYIYKNSANDLVIFSAGFGEQAKFSVGGIEFSNKTVFSNTLDATDTTSGAVQVRGGAAIAKNLYVGGDLIPLGNQSSNSNVCIGMNAGTIDGVEVDCVIIGRGAYSDDNYATVIGRDAYSDGGEDSVVVGDYSSANGNNNISVGSYCRVGDDAISSRSVGIGADSIIGNHDDSVWIGYDFYGYGDRTVGIGGRHRNGFTQAAASDQILLGYGASWYGANTMQIGGNRVWLTVTGKSGNFVDGEVVTGGTSGATGLSVDNAFDNNFNLAMTSAANFQVGETITGATSGHTATISNITTYYSPINTVRFNRGVETISFVNPVSFVDNANVGGHVSIGKGLKVSEGDSDAAMGVVTTVDGTATVYTTAVTANSRIFLTIQNNGGTAEAVEVTSRIAGTSFTISCSGGAGHSHDVAWLLINPN